MFLFSSHIAIAAQLANPASTHCIEVGGKLELLKRGDGGEYGVCIFEDNRQCEEWSLFRGICPSGGVKITGYTTPAQIYCAIQGGKTFATDGPNDPRNKKAKCLFSNGSKCYVEDFYNGKCQIG